METVKVKATVTNLRKTSQGYGGSLDPECPHCGSIEYCSTGYHSKVEAITCPACGKEYKAEIIDY